MDLLGVGSIISGIGGIGQSILNPVLQTITNKKNIAFQREENEIMRQREDTAVQRRMQDLTKAGINPLMAGQNPASSQMGGVVQAQAPQVDTSQITNALNTIAGIKAQKQQIEIQEKIADAEIDLKKAQADDLKENTKNRPIELNLKAEDIRIREKDIDNKYDIGKKDIKIRKEQGERSLTNEETKTKILEIQTNFNERMLEIQEKLTDEQIKKLKAEVENISAQAKLGNLTYEQAQNLEDTLKEMGISTKEAGMLGNILNMLIKLIK